jgi:hypothetical protein
MTNKKEIEAFLLAEFSEVECAIKHHFNDVVVNKEFFSNDFFFIRTYVSFSMRPGEEAVVISLDCKIRHENLIIETDLCLGDGTVIAEGPAGAVAIDKISSFMRPDSEWGRSFHEFMVAATFNVVERLEAIQ